MESASSDSGPPYSMRVLCRCTGSKMSAISSISLRERASSRLAAVVACCLLSNALTRRGWVRG